MQDACGQSLSGACVAPQNQRAEVGLGNLHQHVSGFFGAIAVADELLDMVFGGLARRRV